MVDLKNKIRRIFGDDSDVASLCEAGIDITLPAGELPPRICEGLAIIVSGLIGREILLTDGRRHFVELSVTGDPVVFARPDESDIDRPWCAIGPARLFCFPLEVLRDWTGRSGMNLDRLLRQLAKLRERDGLLTAVVAQCTARERVAYLLYRMAASNGTDDQAPNDLRLNRHDLAACLGLNADTVTRELSRLKSGGVLALPRRGLIRLRNYQALAEYASFAA